MYRRRLVPALDGAVRHRPTLLVAPAGWGKTSLLADWHTAGRRERVGWLALDPEDSDPVRFWTYLISAARTVLPGVGERAMATLGIGDRALHDAALPALINDLATLDEDVHLVVDDYHVLTDPELHRSVGNLPAHQPLSRVLELNQGEVCFASTVAHVLLGVALFWKGELAAALLPLTGAAEARHTGNLLGEIYASSYLAVTHVERGAIDEGRRIAGIALSRTGLLTPTVHRRQRSCMPFKDYQPAVGASQTTTNPAAEQELIEALRRRDDDAYRTLVRRYTPLMLRLARQHVPSQAIAEEVVQDSWLAVLRGIDAFQGRCQFSTWLMRILLNTARKRGIREHSPARWDALGTSSAPAEPVQAADSNPEAVVLATETRAMLEQAIRALPERQRAVLVLRDVDGWPADEVCAALEVSTGNQRVLLHRARAAIRSMLQSRDRDLVPA